MRILVNVLDDSRRSESDAGKLKQRCIFFRGRNGGQETLDTEDERNNGISEWVGRAAYR